MTRVIPRKQANVNSKQLFLNLANLHQKECYDNFINLRKSVSRPSELTRVINFRIFNRFFFFKQKRTCLPIPFQRMLQLHMFAGLFRQMNSSLLFRNCTK